MSYSNTKKRALKVNQEVKFLGICLCIFISGCVSIPTAYEGLAPGVWRGVLKLADKETDVNPLEETKNYRGYTELPFNFTVTNTTDSLYIEFTNGVEKIKVDAITVGLDRSTAKDTVIIEFEEYDTYFEGIIDENIMEGYWHVNYKQGYSIPYIAYHGQSYRFTTANNATKDFDGTWEVTFDYDKPDQSYQAVGTFEQNGSDITGTFQTETGDYRYLQGNVIKDKMKLSVFDGSHAFYFEAKQVSDGEMVGVFRSGRHYTSNWTAKKNANIKLASPFDLTTSDNQSIDWSQLKFKDADGKLVTVVPSESDQVTLLNIMGTWCPNCKDEMNYLKEVRIKYPDVQITTVSYERYKDESKNLAAIKRYRQAMDIQWPIYLGGYASKAESSEDFPFLSKIISYPTLLVLDKENKIRSIHTGFNGPATQEYPEFKKEMNHLIEQLINE